MHIIYYDLLDVLSTPSDATLRAKFVHSEDFFLSPYCKKRSVKYQIFYTPFFIDINFCIS